MTDRPDVVTACLIIIGNEILSGRTRDANLPFLAGRLNELGVRLREARVIPDNEATIVATVNECRHRFTYVFTTGGIGPTHDDITADSVAKAFGVRLVRNPEAVRRLREHYAEGDLNEARLRMANIPEGADLLDNPVSRAPGFRLGNVFVLPGVPTIMQAIFEGFRHQLVGGRPVLSRAVIVYAPEGTIAERLRALQARFPEVEMGSYPFLRRDRLGTSVVLRAVERERIDAAADALWALVRELGVAAEEDPTIGGGAG
jgi:molybdenum cofactor synthesis domain-containing protein